MLTYRAAQDRGHADHGWLDTWHSFSFSSYFDPARMGFRSLRVINDDRVAPSAGFPSHPHRDMEIVTYVLDGALSHRDSLGTGSVIRPGDVQRMTAGTGVVHSEFNASAQAPVHLLQIWLLPERRDLAPGYEQKSFAAAEKRGKLRLVASRDGAQDSVQIHQDARLFAGLFAGDEATQHTLLPGRHGYLHVARGTVRARVGDTWQELGPGDALELSADPGPAKETVLEIAASGSTEGEVLLFDLA